MFTVCVTALSSYWYCPFTKVVYKPLQFTSIGALTMFRHTGSFLLLGAILQLAIGQSINLCPPCNCEDFDALCIEDEINDSCSCCKRCHKVVGENCGDGDEGICNDGLLCLPNNPYSSSSSGTCFEINECLTFGCTDESGECICMYSGICPVRRFPYYTIDDCEDALAQSACANVSCPSTTVDCGPGMYFEQGPAIYDDCCPVNGKCMCNMSLCPEPPVCSENEMLEMISEANKEEGRCCSEYQCKKGEMCIYNGKVHSIGEEWIETPCMACHCSILGANCSDTNCTLPNDCAVTFVPDGECCPICIDPIDTIDPASLKLKCVADDGKMYDEGEKWSAGPCRDCMCELGDIFCQEKICAPVVCDGTTRYVPAGECCPTCMNQTAVDDNDMSSSPLVPTKTSFTEQDTILKSSTPQQTPSNIDTSTDIVMVLPTSFDVVNKKWNEFALDIMTMLESNGVHIKSINVMRDTSMMNASVLQLTAVQSSSSKYQIASMVTEVAQDYKFVMQNPQVKETVKVAEKDLKIDSNLSDHLTATVIVLTLLAALALISFIGVVVILVAINRRLRLAKSINGTATQRRPRRNNNNNY